MNIAGIWNNKWVAGIVGALIAGGAVAHTVLGDAAPLLAGTKYWHWLAVAMVVIDRAVVVAKDKPKTVGQAIADITGKS